MRLPDKCVDGLRFPEGHPKNFPSFELGLSGEYFEISHLIKIGAQ